MWPVKSLLFLLLTLLLTPVSVLASAPLWRELPQAQRHVDPDRSLERRFRADADTLKRILARADFEGRAITSAIELPLANGRIERFELAQSPIMEPALAAKFPDFKTYRVRGIDDPALTGRLSYTAKGFHGMISGPSGAQYIDPQGSARFRVYRPRHSLSEKPFKCGVKSHTPEHPAGRANRSSLRTPGSLRVYRLAVAATAEYTAAVGGTLQLAMAEIVTAINRVNEIYQRDLGIKLVLVGNNDQLIYQGDVNADPYSNDNGTKMLGENQTNIDQVIGVANYDIGHVFSTGGGGIAEVESVCSNLKAEGVTGLSNPSGEAFYIDYVAHEIGHQFGGQHTFNGTEGSCNGNRWAVSAFEPGSGSTIMSYAGICGAENISRHAIAVFHAGSIDLVDDYTRLGNTGATCGATQVIGNAFEPIIDGGGDYTIPAQTPFVLSANASDGDGDTLTYSWDQMDAGTQTDQTTFGQDLGNNSLFRSYLPRPENQRHFPALGTTLQNLYDDSEVMACSSRALDFRVTAFDGKSGIGRDNVKISVTKNAGPFAITSFSSSQRFRPGALATLDWNVANTDQPPVNCSKVDISLLTFNVQRDLYHEVSLASNRANNGSALVTIPDVNSIHARFKVQCSNNIFYDISDADLIIDGSQPFDISSARKVYYDDEGKLYTLSSLAPTNCDLSASSNTGGGTTGGSGGSTTPKTGGGSGGMSGLEIFALLLLLLLKWTLVRDKAGCTTLGRIRECNAA